jgi:hypothetical protein
LTLAGGADTLLLRARAFGLEIPDTADALAVLAPWLALPEWLSAALADLLVTVNNMMRSDDSAPLHRDEFLDAWGLPSLAKQYRRQIEAFQKESAQADAATLANFLRQFRKDPQHEEAHTE